MTPSENNVNGKSATPFFNINFLVKGRKRELSLGIALLFD
jgi:hypothetical protein